MDVSASSLQLHVHALPWDACVQNFGMHKEEDMQVSCLATIDYFMMHMSGTQYHFCVLGQSAHHLPLRR